MKPDIKENPYYGKSKEELKKILLSLQFDLKTTRRNAQLQKELREKQILANLVLRNDIREQLEEEKGRGK